jgi:hypothetical protein
VELPAPLLLLDPSDLFHQLREVRLGLGLHRFDGGPGGAHDRGAGGGGQLAVGQGRAHREFSRRLVKVQSPSGTRPMKILVRGLEH